MWKNSVKNVESENNKILYEILLDFFLQRNGTYFLNKPRIFRGKDWNITIILFKQYVSCYMYPKTQHLAIL